MSEQASEVAGLSITRRDSLQAPRPPARLDEARYFHEFQARKSALQVPENEERALLEMRTELLRSKLARELTAEEASRLEYVRWSLDRIDDARYGLEIDRLADAVTKYRQAVTELQNLNSMLRTHLPQKKK